MDTAAETKQPDNLHTLIMPKASPLEKALKAGVVRMTVGSGFECVVCGSPLSGESSVVQHLEGSKHREKSTRYAITHIKNGPQTLIESLPSKTREAAKKGLLLVLDNAVKCTICGNALTGVQQIEDHLAGEDHKKKATSQQMAAIAQPRPPVPTVPVTVAAIAPQPLQEDKLVQQKLKEGIIMLTDNKVQPYLCPICNNKSFNSSATLLDHLKSKKHKRMEVDVRNKLSVGQADVLPPTSSQELDRRNQPIYSGQAEVFPPTSQVGLPSPDLTYGEQKSYLYSVMSIPRGHVYVFNYTFSGQNHWQRSGAEFDSENLRSTFTQMNYDVFIVKDLTGSETYETFKQIVRDPRLMNVDSLIMFFLSHGKDPYTFYANDRQELNLFNIRHSFIDSKCVFMKGKPKIFFTNYCRGDKMEKKAVDAIEPPNDIVTIHAATEGIKAIRSLDFGTCFVRSLCSVLKRFPHLELRDIYFHLERAMKENNGTKPMWEDYGFRRFHFNPTNVC